MGVSDFIDRHRHRSAPPRPRLPRRRLSRGPAAEIEAVVKRPCQLTRLERHRPEIAPGTGVGQAEVICTGQGFGPGTWQGNAARAPTRPAEIKACLSG